MVMQADVQEMGRQSPDPQGSRADLDVDLFQQGIHLDGICSRQIIRIGLVDRCRQRLADFVFKVKVKCRPEFQIELHAAAEKLFPQAQPGFIWNDGRIDNSAPLAITCSGPMISVALSK